MKKTFYLSFFLTIIVCFTYAQQSLNAYKYIIVPEHFEFLKHPDQYQVNSLTEFLFDREGFNVVSTTRSYPTDLAANSCIGLRVNVVDDSKMFKTSLKIVLTDCRNQIAYESKFGTTREKDFKKAYHEALRMAFEEFESMNYSYDPELTVATAAKEAVSIVEKSTEKLVKAKEITLVESEEVKSKKITEKQVAKEKADKTSLIKRVEAVDVAKTEKKETVPDVKPEPVQKILENKQQVERIMTIEGDFNIGNYGRCTIAKKGDIFKIYGGDERIEIGSVYGTSEINVFIVKWMAFKQPRLLRLDSDGNLKVDASEGVDIYERVD